MTTQAIFDAVLVFDNVGGAPVLQEYAECIGADGYGADAPGAVRRVRELIPG